MINRKALLIGVEEYGAGFVSLPSVRTDLALLDAALKAMGYETELCSQEDVVDASKLDKRMRRFCASGGPDDVRLLYFTGHGILVDDVDWVIPAQVTRQDAIESPNQRVSTDLSKTVAAAKTGLVLFVIDACRDAADVPITKGTAEWGDPRRIDRPGEHRFVRFFGCAAHQVCQVVTSEDEPPSSLFTRSLASSLASKEAVSLSDVMSKVEAKCNELLARNPRLQKQTPRLSYGDLSDAKRRVLELAIFDPVGDAAPWSVWPQFDPNKFHCLVLLSERGAQSTSDWGLTELVRDAVAGATADRIWNAFHSVSRDLKLLSNRPRMLPATFEASAVSFAAFSVQDAFASWKSLETAVRTIVEADLAVFDVTNFEPGVMFLLGIRSAARRWLTICSHGAGWKEGQPLDLPFNLQDLNINSHTPRETRAGPDPVVERFVQRVETGFLQVSRQPSYLDLPSYDDLRQLGTDYAASSTIDPTERILYLCSYTDSYFSNWQFVSSRLTLTLRQKGKYAARIERNVDIGTPQLIQQTLYEQIRRTAACIVDWSEYKPAVFLELGVRLAVSDWGAIQLIDDRYLPGKARASRLTQMEGMHRLLGVIPYRYRDDASAAFEQVASVMLERNPNLDGNADYNRIHRTVQSMIGGVQAALPPLVQQLKRRADALHHPEQSRVGAPQILFHGSREAKQDAESAARELRIAAWLYLEHRLRISEGTRDDQLLGTYQELGRSAVNALYDLGDDESIALAGYIEDRLGPRK